MGNEVHALILRHPRVTDVSCRQKVADTGVTQQVTQAISVFQDDQGITWSRVELRVRGFTTPVTVDT
jgi:Cu2+-containing amine oxidase